MVRLALLLAVCAAARAEPLPVEYFTRNDEVGLLKISPDGAFLAATGVNSGTSVLMFIDVAEWQVVGGIRAIGDDEIVDVDWVSDTRVIYAYGLRYVDREYIVRLGEIFAVDRDGKRNVMLYGRRASNQWTGSNLGTRESTKAWGELLSAYDKNDDEILILERRYRRSGRKLVIDQNAHPRVSKLDVYSGHLDLDSSVPLAMADVVVDQDDRVRFATGYDRDSELKVIWRPKPGDEWTEFSLPGLVDESVTPQRFAADGGSVLFTGVGDGESLEALYRLDLDSRTVERLFQHPDVDVSGVVMDMTGRFVVGARFESDRTGYHWLDPENPTARLYEELQRAFPGNDVVVAGTTRDGNLALVLVYSDVNPGDYYLFDIGQKKARHLQATRPWVDPALMRPKEPIVAVARDGTRLHGYLTRPEGREPYPLIVLPHGGPYGSRDHWRYDWEVQLFASRGYAVLQVNYRGSAGYGLTFAEAGYGEWGALMQDDLTDATRWVIDQGLTTSGSVCIYGSGYGGYAALMGVVREPDLYRCAIGRSGVYDLELMFDSGDVRRWRAGRARLDAMYGDDTDLRRLRSPVNFAEEIHTPVLLVHGDRDWRSDFEQAIRMRRALERAGRTVEWSSLRGEGPGIDNQENRRETYEMMLRFLDDHLRQNRAGGAAEANSM